MQIGPGYGPREFRREYQLGLTNRGVLFMRNQSRMVLASGAGIAIALGWCLPANAAPPLQVQYGTAVTSYFVDEPATGWPGGGPQAGGAYGTGGYRQSQNALYVTDMRKDGMRVAIHWRLADGTQRGLCVNDHGAGITVAVNIRCNLITIQEDRTIEIRMGRCDGDAHSCEQLSHFEQDDWSAWHSHAV
jgi:hypothetical protein